MATLRLGRDESMKSLLLMDALYYHAAQQACSAANQTTRAIDRANAAIEKLVAKEERILAKHAGDHHKASGELESVYIQMEGAQYKLGEAHGPLMEHAATVHILSAAALEAHVNAQADSLLGGGKVPNSRKLLEHFDHLPLEGKWLLLPRFLGKRGFDPGAEPFQGFARLVELRNALVHYKMKKEEWKSLELPGFIEELGLNLTIAESSLKAAKGMIESLARQLGQDTPHWLRASSANFFDVEVE